MRVLLLAMHTEGQFGLMRYFDRAFKSLGHETRIFTVVGDTTSRSIPWVGDTQLGVLANRAKTRVRRLQLARPRAVRQVASDVAALLADFRPDVAVTAKGVDVTDAVLDAFEEAGVPLYNYYPDPIPLEDAGFLARIPRYAGFFTYNRDQIPRIYWFGAKYVGYLPFASDPEVHRPKRPTPERLAYYESPVAYLATWQPYAEFWPGKLLEFGLKIWGNQWGKLPARHPVRRAWQGENKGTHDELALVCSSSAVVFNVVRAANGLSHSMKTFEIPACGGFMLTNRTEEQQAFFREGIEAEYFSTPEELLDKTRFYLRNDEKRRKIAEAGHAAAQQHLYTHRVSDLLSQVRAQR